MDWLMKFILYLRQICVLITAFAFEKQENLDKHMQSSAKKHTFTISTMNETLSSIEKLK